MPRSRNRRGGKEDEQDDPDSPALGGHDGRCLALSLCCAYLDAFDLASLARSNTLLRRLTRDCVKTLQINCVNTSSDSVVVVVRSLAGLFPQTQRVHLVGTRYQIMASLQASQRMLALPLHSLLVDFLPFASGSGDDETANNNNNNNNNEDGDDEPLMDGLSIGALIRAFASCRSLQELTLANMGPFSPRALTLALMGSGSSSRLRTIRLDGCSTLMDHTVHSIVNNSALQELCITNCASLQRVRLESRSLLVVELGKCFQLELVDVSACTVLRELLVPWSVMMTNQPILITTSTSVQQEEEAPPPPPMTLSRLSLFASAALRFVLLPRCSSLTVLDVSYCVKLEEILLSDCVHLQHLLCHCSPALRVVELYNAHALQTLDLAMLRELESVIVTEAKLLRELRYDGCRKLKRREVRHTATVDV